jgi:hypothetical protein
MCTLSQFAQVQWQGVDHPMILTGTGEPIIRDYPWMMMT